MDEATEARKHLWDELLEKDLVTVRELAAALKMSLPNQNPNQESRSLYKSYFDRFFVRFREKDPDLTVTFYGDGSGVILYQGEPHIFREELPGHSLAGRFDELLFRADRVSVTAKEFLRGTQLRNCVRRIHDLAGACCGVLDTMRTTSTADPPDDDRLRETLEFFETEFESVESYFQESARRRAQIRYANGMLIGAAVLYAVAGLVWSVVSAVDATDGPLLPLMLGVLAAGCTGAVVSVMQRMTKGNLDIDYTMGTTVVTIGMFRPVVGAVFALALFLTLQGGLVPHLEIPPVESETFFFLAIGFATGFSERLAQDMLTTTERTLGQSQTTDGTATPKG